jgi:hypothetical protein
MTGGGGKQGQFPFLIGGDTRRSAFAEVGIAPGRLTTHQKRNSPCFPADSRSLTALLTGWGWGDILRAGIGELTRKGPSERKNRVVWLF